MPGKAKTQREEILKTAFSCALEPMIPGEKAASGPS